MYLNLIGNRFICVKFWTKLIITAVFISNTTAVASNWLLQTIDQDELSDCKDALRNNLTHTNQNDASADLSDVSREDLNPEGTGPELNKYLELLNESYSITSGNELLFYAIEEENVRLVKLVVGAPKTNPNEKDEQKNTPLILAAKSGNEEVVRALLNSNKKIKVNKVDNNGYSAIMWAASLGHRKIIELLLEETTILLFTQTANESAYYLYFNFFNSLPKSSKTIEQLSMLKRLNRLHYSQLRNGQGI